MNALEKDSIVKMRSDGMSYAAIASALGLKEITVKKHCQRNHISATHSDAQESRAYTHCRECGKELLQVDKKKRRLFCCEDCRSLWWHKHPDQIKQKAVYSYHCAHCGKGFTAYGNDHRKYCCHACYIAERYSKGGAQA